MNNDAKTVKQKYLPDDCALVGYEIRNKKEYEKRSRWDSSKHLLIYFIKESGSLCRIVASHQNNQSIKLHHYNYWFEDGFEYLKKIPLKITSPEFHWTKNIGVYENLEDVY